MIINHNQLSPTRLLAIAAALTLAGQACANTYTVLGNSVIDVSGTNIPAMIDDGAYNDVTGDGTWSVTFDLSAFGQPSTTITQNWVLDSQTGQGSLFTNDCSTQAVCLGINGSLTTDFTATPTPIGAGDYVFHIPTGSAEIALNVTLTPVPVPAAAWLFGTALLSLAGVKSRLRGH